MEKEVSKIKTAQIEGLAIISQKQDQLSAAQGENYKELAKIQGEENKKAAQRAVHVSQRLESLAQGQRDICNTQDNHKKKLDAIKVEIIADLQRKTDTATGSITEIVRRQRNRRHRGAHTLSEQQLRTRTIKG